MVRSVRTNRDGAVLSKNAHASVTDTGDFADAVEYSVPERYIVKVAPSRHVHHT